MWINKTESHNEMKIAEVKMNTQKKVHEICRNRLDKPKNIMNGSGSHTS